jgi:hypothetical protein
MDTLYVFAQVVRWAQLQSLKKGDTQATLRIYRKRTTTNLQTRVHHHRILERLGAVEAGRHARWPPSWSRGPQGQINVVVVDIRKL